MAGPQIKATAGTQSSRSLPLALRLRVGSASKSPSPPVKPTAKTILARIVAERANVDAPLAQARDLLHALLVMGYGMITGHEENGEPIVAVVEVAWQRLDAARVPRRGACRVDRSQGC